MSVSKPLELAPVRVRFVAFCMDMLLAFLLIMLLLTQWLLPTYFAPETQELYELFSHYQIMDSASSLSQEQISEGLKEVVIFIQAAFFMGVWFYFALSEILMDGGSLGKKIFNLNVIDLKTGDIPRKRVLWLRSFVKTVLLGVLSPIMWTSFLVTLFTKRKQGVHDMIFKTTVVYAYSIQNNKRF